LKKAALKDDHEATLGWLDDSLEWSRLKGRTRLMTFLNLVRTEVLFEKDFNESPRSIRNRAPATGSSFGANRGI